MDAITTFVDGHLPKDVGDIVVQSMVDCRVSAFLPVLVKLTGFVISAADIRDHDRSVHGEEAVFRPIAEGLRGRLYYFLCSMATARYFMAAILPFIDTYSKNRRQEHVWSSLRSTVAASIPYLMDTVGPNPYVSRFLIRQILLLIISSTVNFKSYASIRVGWAAASVIINKHSSSMVPAGPVVLSSFTRLVDRHGCSRGGFPRGR